MNESDYDLAAAGNNATLIDLLRVAQGDPTVRKRLIGILSLDSSQRVPLLRTLADEMQLEGKPREFVAAFMSLTDDTVAASALDLLKREPIDDPGMTESVPSQLARIPKILVGIVAGAGCPIALLAIGAGLLWSCFVRLPSAVSPILLVAAFILVLLCATVGARLLERRSWRTTVGAAVLTGLLFCVAYFVSEACETRAVKFTGKVLRHMPLSIQRTANGTEVAYTVYQVDAVLAGRIRSKEITVYPDASSPTHDPIPVGSPVRVRALENHYGMYTAVSERWNPAGAE